MEDPLQVTFFLTAPHPPDARAGPLGPPPGCHRTAGPQAGGPPGSGSPLSALRPPRETTLRQPLLAQPEALTIIDQDLDRLAAAVAEYENASAEGIAAKRHTTQTRQPIDPLAKIRRLNGQPNPHLGCNLDHAWPPRNPPAREASSDRPAPMTCIRTVAPLPSAHSIVHSTQPGGIAPGTSSMKSGLVFAGTNSSAPLSSRCFLSE